MRMKGIVLLCIHATSIILGNDITIITPTSDRWQELRELRLASASENPIGISFTYNDELQRKPSFYKTFLDTVQQQQAWLVCAEKNGRLIGMIGAIQECASSSLLEHLVTITNVYVLPEFRKAGIATMLMQELLDQLLTNTTAKQAMLYVTTTLTAPIRLYEKHGFRICGKLSNALIIEGKSYDQYLMERTL